jgi:hypothetical protein
MSDEQFEAHGLPRREFLKRVAIGAMAAPVIVSFGLGGTAEASNGCFPNQSLANQRAQQIGLLVIAVWNYEQQDLVKQKFAAHVRRLLLQAEEKLLDDDLKACCRRLNELLRVVPREAGKQIDANFANSLAGSIGSISASLGCESC